LSRPGDLFSLIFSIAFEISDSVMGKSSSLKHLIFSRDSSYYIENTIKVENDTTAV
jgi:hypothetical protein